MNKIEPNIAKNTPNQENKPNKEKSKYLRPRTQKHSQSRKKTKWVLSEKAKKVPWARSPPMRLTAMKMPMMIPRVPKTRRDTARAISLIGALLFIVYEVSIIMSSSVIENAWSTYANFFSFFLPSCSSDR